MKNPASQMEYSMDGMNCQSNKAEKISMTQQQKCSTLKHKMKKKKNHLSKVNRVNCGTILSD